MKMSKLLALALVLLISVGTLAGSTIAWFTDKVISERNTITAGNLDIEVQYKTPKMNAYEELTATTEIFNDSTLWEPGHTEVVALKIKNAGTLALKYKTTLTIHEETPSTNVNDEAFKLSDHLTVLSQTNENNMVGEMMVEHALSNRNYASGVANGLTKGKFNEPLKGVGEMYEFKLQPNAENVAVIAVTMPTTVGNEANYKKDAVVPQITFGLAVEAAQFTVESDSFGIDYDKDALYPGEFVVSTAAELAAAFAEGGDITLADDIELTERLNLAADTKVNLDLNGKTITAKTGSEADPVFYTYKGSTLTIDGNGTVELEDPFMSLIFPGGDVVIENGTFVRNVPAGTTVDQVGALIVGAKVSPWGSQTVTINGGYFDGGYYDKNAADIDEILAGTKTLTETADDIAKRGNSKDANAVRVALKNNIQLTLNLSYNLFKVKGGTFVGVNPAWGDEGCMLPTKPNYLRPWSYYQGALIEGQTFNENGIVLPKGYTITKGETKDGTNRPTYTVTYSE